VFTGIIEEVGEIVATDDLGDAARLIIRGPVVTVDARHGDSIAVNGVCLTVVDVLPEGEIMRIFSDARTRWGGVFVLGQCGRDACASSSPHPPCY
jgi:riboflavin synthase alpha subunit